MRIKNINGNLACVSPSVSVYPVSVNNPQTARVGANPLLFHMVKHVDEQRAVHLVGQVDGRVTLRKNNEETMSGTTNPAHTLKTFTFMQQFLSAES